MTQQKKLMQCEFCKTLISSQMSLGVCDECRELDHALFNKTKGFLKFGEKILPEELSERAGVDLKHIQRWIHNGRFNLDL